MVSLTPIYTDSFIFSIRNLGLSRAFYYPVHFLSWFHSCLQKINSIFRQHSIRAKELKEFVWQNTLWEVVPVHRSLTWHSQSQCSPLLKQIHKKRKIQLFPLFLSSRKLTAGPTFYGLVCVQSRLVGDICLHQQGGNFTLAKCDDCHQKWVWNIFKVRLSLSFMNVNPEKNHVSL